MSDGAKRVAVLLTCGALAAVLLVGRLLQLQAVDASSLALTAAAQRLTTISLPADRGSITDASGVPLATSVEAWNITVDQTLVTDPGKTATALAPILKLPIGQIQAALTGKRRFAYVTKLVTPQVRRAVVNARQPGIFSERTSERVYPNGDLAAGVIGFVDTNGVGKGGIEYLMQPSLAGKAGQRTEEVASDGQLIPGTTTSGSDPVPGSTVRLTIDRDLQYVAQQAIAAKVRQSGSESGNVIVMDVRTGNILAMAIAPSFDPGELAQTPRDTNLGNRALSEIYEPGSTAKVMTMAALIESGKVNPTTVITIPSSLRRGGYTIRDSEPHGVLHYTLNGVLARSSNMGTILASEVIPAETLYDTMSRFGIGQATGMPFPGEETGTLAPWQTWNAAQHATIAFGQGLAVTSLQAASVYATIANGGVRVQPRLIAGVTGPDGTYTPATSAPGVRVVSAATASTVTTMLESVVSADGTAPNAAIKGYRVAGKTGTANRIDSTGKYSGYTASFIGFAPADAPRIVVAVVLQDPHGVHYGSLLGGPVFTTVMSYALAQSGIAPDGTRSPQWPVTDVELRAAQARAAATAAASAAAAAAAKASTAGTLSSSTTGASSSGGASNLGGVTGTSAGATGLLGPLLWAGSRRRARRHPCDG